MGVNQNIIVIDAEKPFEMINPRIIGYSGPEIEEEEGCLSIPALYGLVIRPETIRVMWFNRDKKSFNAEFNGLTSRVIQHEIDHLAGILFIDRVVKDTLNWKHPE